MGFKHGRVMCSWLLNIFLGEVLSEKKKKSMTLGKGTSLNYEGRSWKMSALVFADDAVLLALNSVDGKELETAEDFKSLGASSQDLAVWRAN